MTRSTELNVVELTVKQIKEEFGTSRFKSASLQKGKEGYALSLCTETELVPVLLRDAGDLKSWANIGTAVAFIRDNFAGVTSINVQLGA